MHFLWILCCHWKRTVSLPFFGKNAMFHSAYLPKTCNSSSFLKLLFTAKRPQFYSMFLPTTIKLTPCCRQKCEVWLHFFAEDAQNNQKTHNYKDNAKFHSAFLVTMLGYATHFRWKSWGIENFEYLGKFGEEIAIML